MITQNVTIAENCTVLFIDDEPSVLNALRRIFADESYRCIYASSAAEALRLVHDHSIWVAVSDNLMPEGNGIDLLARFKTISPDTVRIMMTSCIEQEVAIAAINKSEAFRFIAKPWNNEELVTMVREGINRYEMLLSLRSNDEARYRSLAQAIELKDPYTRGHCDRVRDYAQKLAIAVGVSEQLIPSIRQGGILHDCGKIGIPEAVLNFPGRLSTEDYESIKRHPELGASLAREALLPTTVTNIILYHHERYDGAGYPTGLAGISIPFEARIAAIADVYDALTSDRAYRKAHTREEALQMMNGMSGQFDPQLLCTFRSIAISFHPETPDEKYVVSDP